MVPTDSVLDNHRDSFNGSLDSAKVIFGKYMQYFLTLNTDLRTDASNITSLLDNVPSVFYMPDKGDECYYSF